MAKIISFLAEKNKIGAEQKRDKNLQNNFSKTPQKEMGVLVWLYCSKCQTLEYSEIISTNGRLHKCQSEVVEKEVAIDITAEYTICKRNLFYIDTFYKNFLTSKRKKIEIEYFKIMIENLQSIESQMIQKLKKITKKKELIAYDWNLKNVEFLPIANITSIGLAVSDFRYRPKARFETIEFFSAEELAQDDDASPEFFSAEELDQDDGRSPEYLDD